MLQIRMLKTGMLKTRVFRISMLQASMIGPTRNVPHAAWSIVPILVASLLGACREQMPQALGTLEYDRITLPAPAAERIVAIDVREGERVHAGQLLLQL